MRSEKIRWSLLANLVLAVGLMLSLSACGDPVSEDSSTVGGPCTSNDDCKEICLTGSDWPGGMCTLSCRDDADCPGGSACIDEERGVCLMECRGDEDCPSGYECDDEDRKGHRGKIHVCMED